MKLTIKYFILVLPLLIASCNLINPVGGNHVAMLMEIGSINTDGRNQKLIANNPAGYYFTGNYIINNYDILTEMNLDGSNLHNLLPTNLSTHDFSISPNATKIVVSTGTNVLSPGTNLYIMNIDGKGLTQINLPDSIINVINPKISFNDSLIVFASKTGLYKINVDGKNLVKLKGNPLDTTVSYAQPSFSADDQNIIYATYNKPSGNPIDIHRLSLKDLSDTAFYNFGSMLFTSLEISPQNILLIKSTGGNIYSIDLNNFNATLIARGSNAAYSFDYKKITYVDPDTSNTICIMDLNTKVTTKVTLNFPNSFDTGVYDSKLSVDGTTLLYTDSRMVSD